MVRKEDTITISSSPFCGLSWRDFILVLRAETNSYPELMADRIARETESDPFRLLVAIMLSARVRDETTEEIVDTVFSCAKTPEEVLRIPSSILKKILRPLGTYRQKAKNLRGLCRMLVDEFEGSVPETLDELIRLPGVGIKTASLVLIRAFDKHAISVDTHVHRLSNAFGFVLTKTPEQTECALREVLPRRYWKEWNRLLVTLGKFLCPRDSNVCILKLEKRLEGHI